MLRRWAHLWAVDTPGWWAHICALDPRSGVSARGSLGRLSGGVGENVGVAGNLGLGVRGEAGRGGSSAVRGDVGLAGAKEATFHWCYRPVPGADTDGMIVGIVAYPLGLRMGRDCSSWPNFDEGVVLLAKRHPFVD